MFSANCFQKLSYLCFFFLRCIQRKCKIFEPVYCFWFSFTGRYILHIAPVWLAYSYRLCEDIFVRAYVCERGCVCVSGKTFTLKLETALWIISEARHVHPENLKMHQASQKKGSGVCWHEQYKGKLFTGTVWGADAYRNSLWKGNCLHEYLGRKKLQNK